MLALRRDANRTLTTILWGSVAINGLFPLLADSVLAGLAAFLFSTVLITVVGEIIPQAYCSRHALNVAALLAPVLRFYRVLLWPLAWPSGRLLDAWIGPEGMPWVRERDLRRIIEPHARDPNTEISRVEATGAFNVLALDDPPAGQEGEPLDPKSVVPIRFEGSRPVSPDFARRADDPFLRQLADSGKK